MFGLLLTVFAFSLCACNGGQLGERAAVAPSAQSGARDQSPIIKQLPGSSETVPAAVVDDPVSQAGQPVQRQPPAIPAQPADAKLVDAMSHFVNALRKKDSAAFLKLFSRSAPFHDVTTITDPAGDTLIDYATLAHDLKAKEGLYESLFDADGDSCYRDHVVDSQGKPWRWVGDGTFVPPDSDDRSVYVRWRKEQNHYVVDIIAEPSA